MLNLTKESFILCLPLICSGVIHMIVVRLGFFSFLARPISPVLFGENKTYRGFFVLILSTIAGVYLANLFKIIPFDSVNLNLLGGMLGFAYALFELPNSFIKRRLGIAPGKMASRNKFLFTIIDQGDSVFGCLIVYLLMLKIGWGLALYCLLFAIVVHMLMNLLLFALRLRKNPL